MNASTALVWFRRDLRVRDHAALHHALNAHGKVHALFVFDPDLQAKLPSKDRRIDFILKSLGELDASLEELARATGIEGAGLLVRSGDPREVVPRVAQALGVKEVVCSRDYEPQARRRDRSVGEALQQIGIGFTSLRDQVIFEEDELLNGSGRMYSVFTPYRNAWMKALHPPRLASREVEGAGGRMVPKPAGEVLPSLRSLGFEDSGLGLPTGISGARRLWIDFQERIDAYGELRDFPSRKGVSLLSAHLRFGTLSIRELVRFALERGSEGASVWLNELVWRDFYQQLLWHRPDLETRAFRPGYDDIRWEEGPQAEAHFRAWCEGMTGYPLVDAAMRQLVQTGWMHNRLRMVVASFLTKDLGIHWLRGERFFARHLLDYDLAANNGGWQWAASTGCDAQPWFRIFNPVTQSRKFDPDGAFIRQFCPELGACSDKAIHAPWIPERGDASLSGERYRQNYPAPLVDHALARQRTLERFRGMGPEA